MIQIVGLRKRFDTRWVTDGIDLTIPGGQMTVIVGRSGEGKSVLLKQIIGLIEPTAGHVLVDGINVTEISKKNPTEVFKTCGYVFQFAALLDSLNIFHNICLAQLEQGISPQELLPLVQEKLRMVNLSDDILYRYPSELSGGMRKRVGLARTLMGTPQIILYDEPTTGLDPITSRVIFELMATMQKQFNLTSVIISHDIEIFNYADNVALLYEGTIKFFGSAKTIWDSDNPYIAQFIRGSAQGPIQAT